MKHVGYTYSYGKLMLATVFLLAGGSIYLLLRPQTLLLFRVADAMGVSEAIGQLRLSASGVLLPGWVVYCLPNALWSCAYILITDALFHQESTCQRIMAAAIIPLVGLLSEVAQACGMLPGTFDGGDLVAYALPYLVYLSYNLQKTFIV